MNKYGRNCLEAHDSGAIVSTHYGLGKIVQTEKTYLRGNLTFAVAILGKSATLKLKSGEMRKI